MRRAALLIGSLIAIWLLGGCGEEPARSARSGDETVARANRSSERPPATRAELARTLVRLDDLPSGWEEQRASGSILRCGSVRPFRAARRIVSSQRFQRENYGVQETVAVFRTAAASRAAMARLNARTATECLRRHVRRSMSEQLEAQASRPELVRIDSLDGGGRASRFTATTYTQAGPFQGYVDAVHLRVGRSVAALLLVAGPEPLSEELYDDVVAVAERRLRDAFG